MQSPITNSSMILRLVARSAIAGSACSVISIWASSAGNAVAVTERSGPRMAVDAGSDDRSDVAALLLGRWRKARHRLALPAV